MSLHNYITIRSAYTRSINVEKHSSSLESVVGYLPTSRALDTLQRVVDTFGNREVPRSWSLVGPYGSGKSAFAVFLSALLTDPVSQLQKQAHANLHNVSKALSDSFSKEINNTSGYLRVMISGSSEPLLKRILQSFHQATINLWGEDEGQSPEIVRDFETALNTENMSANELVSLVAKLQFALSTSKTHSLKGIVLVIDELGKFLEYASRHEDSNDLFVLQAIAEHAQQPNEVTLMQFVMLHKSFEQYALGLSEQSRNQWAAVQGRFEEIPFIENTEQVLRVVSRAIEQNDSVPSATQVQALVTKTVKVLESEGALPSLLNHDSAVALFTDCYPLHPCSALLLPYLCQQVAQNERTLFSYLGSSEAFGFQSMLSSLNQLGDVILPHDIYNYFIANQTTVLGDFQTQRRWVEVITAIERLGDVENQATINLLKTIGLFNIVGAKGGLKPSEEILLSCFESKVFHRAVKELADKSIITHRKFNNEYRVWQGSDFDLHDALEKELDKLKGMSVPLASELMKSNPQQPIVARKYTIQTGALRYFIPVYADASSVHKQVVEDKQAKIIFYLSDDREEQLSALQDVLENMKGANILCVASNSNLLAQVTLEINAYRRISTSQEIHNDPVAKKELEVNLNAAVSNQKKLLNELLYQPEKSTWFYKGRKQPISSKRDIQQVLSKAFHEKYPYMPHVFNELINRDKPSSQAAAGRSKLMKAMLNGQHIDNLGIDKFPPEKAMYMAILKENNLHKKVNGKYIFDAPYGESTYLSVWSKVSDFMDSTEKKAKSFSELSEELMDAPYGVKAGLLPIFYLHAYLLYQDDIAFYEEGKYQPQMTDEHIDRFIRKPEDFTFQLYKVEGINASLINAYSEALYEGKNKNRKVINLARPLVTFYEGLPDFVKSTRSPDLLSPMTLKVRDAIKMSKSPEKLIFEELPVALGYNALEASSKIDVREFSARLHLVIRELKNAYTQLLTAQAQAISSQLHDGGAYELQELRTHLQNQYGMLEHLAIDNTRSFVKRLTDPKGDEKLWLENVLVNMSRKHPSEWKDQDLAKAEANLADLSRRLRELQAIAYEQNRQRNVAKNDSDFEVIMLRSIKQSTHPKERVVTINKSEQHVVDEHIQSMRDIISELDEHTRMAVLAQLIDMELPEGQSYE
ncbi:hypothetical protein [Vibrio mangrovi]|uniref:ATP-binding protein n=1 Tax=Vibrio mangrovi TaxID=474394 RepID=A0A1Y6IQP6_9VIBR|nr:hypothetical protein [Vibrio mangrovi]MDW6003248.1 hypothetical protein [Vibrio mangrovi]SMR99964.1 hypothetical protein VIM7927_01202 [Vibrio mangrovi]